MLANVEVEIWNFDLQKGYRIMKEKVLIARCPGYEPNYIAKVIGQGMDELGIVPQGRVLIKPNVVIAHKFYFTDAFTRSEFIGGLLTAVKSQGAEIQ